MEHACSLPAPPTCPVCHHTAPSRRLASWHDTPTLPPATLSQSFYVYVQRCCATQSVGEAMKAVTTCALVPEEPKGRALLLFNELIASLALVGVV